MRSFTLRQLLTSSDIQWNHRSLLRWQAMSSCRCSATMKSSSQSISGDSFENSQHRINATSINKYRDDEALLGSVNNEMPTSMFDLSSATSTIASASTAEKKLAHLLDGLNPSQVEAVTQPVVDLRDKVGPTSTSAYLELDEYVDRDDSTSTAVITRVIAGPGSGKTKVLTTRIAYLLQQQRPTSRGFQRNLGNVLAVTFTRKAAGAMKERLQRLLRELHDIEIDAEQKVDEEEDDAIRLDRHGCIVQEFVNSEVAEEPGITNPPDYDRVELGTFHSICCRILRHNGGLLNDLPSVQRDMSHAGPVSSQSSQDKVGSPLQIVGKTPESNLNSRFVIVDQSEQLRVLKECLAESKIELNTTSVKPITILNTIGEMKEAFAQGRDPFFQEKDKMVTPALKISRQVYYRYREKLLSNNNVDYDDLILMTREMLIENVDLRNKLHKRWPHVLVDEFQDTSKTQLDLVKLLTSSTLLVVGDADQSIYSWRGAHVGNLNDVKSDFSSIGEVHTVYLKENYRSTSNIVQAAERVISVTSGGKADDDIRRSMKPKRGAGKNPRIVACTDEKSESSFVVSTIMDMLESEEITQTSTVAILYRANSQSRHLEEACVANGLPYVIRGGAGGFYNRAEIKDCLCFLRWLHNGNDTGSMLRAFKTPTKGIGPKAIVDFQDYCDKVQAYFREQQSHRARPTPLDILISMTDGDYAGGNEQPLLLSMDAPQAPDHFPKRALKSFFDFSSKMRDIRATAFENPVDELIVHIIEELKFKDHLAAMSKSQAELSDRLENLQELRRAANEYAKIGVALSTVSEDGALENESGLAAFLDDVALVRDMSDVAEEQKQDEQRFVVNLMTIHASKGAEFDAVFVVGLEDGTLPCTPALKDAAQEKLEEERRLCYVAMTRAKTHLILSWRKEVRVYSDMTSSGPTIVTTSRSRFLDPLVAKSKRNSDRNTSMHRKRTPSHGLNSSTGGVREFSSRSELRSQRLNISEPFPDGPSVPFREVGNEKIPYTQVTIGPGKSKANSEKRTKRKLPSKPSRSQETESPDKEWDRPPSLIDPIWFFPVGEAVLHRSFGRGVVVGHSTNKESLDEPHVRVEFKNGRVLELPALGSDIVPDLGR